MTREDTFLRFQWRDKYGLLWIVAFSESPIGFSGFLASRQVRGTGLIYVQTHDTNDQRQPMAFVNDVRVDPSIENRGLGSMLIREAIKECMRRGHKGMGGHLSEVDRGRFPKLKYFYERLGFSVTIYSENQPSSRSGWAGKIEMVFDN